MFLWDYFFKERMGTKSGELWRRKLAIPDSDWKNPDGTANINIYFLFEPVENIFDMIVYAEIEFAMYIFCVLL